MAESGKILLHSCCAPCASACLERLRGSGYEVILFFSNSNIFPIKEYEQRLDSMRSLAKSFRVALHVDPWDYSSWRKFVAGLEEEPEKGRRCHKCYEYNFRRTHALAKKLRIPLFTSTLSISPHKPSSTLFAVGSHFSGFQPIDFKKKNGFQRSLELSREHALYRQGYCGCEFSLRPKA